MTLAVVVLAQAATPATSLADVVSDWDVTMIEAQTVANTPTPPGTRLAAIVQASVFDAVNGMRPRYRYLHVPPAAPRYASRQAAAAGAAHEALVALFPSQQPLFDARLAASLATISADTRAIDAGLTWGTAVADGILAWRAHDGSDSVLPPYVAGTLPGDWMPTPPAFVATPTLRAVGVTTPFGLSSASQFRPPGPPPLTSAAYAAAFDEVKSVGSLTSTTRTPSQTQTALFWASDSVVGFWNRVALQLVARHHRSLVAEARTFALLNLSMADGAIADWEAKNFFDTWRPITAIEQAAADGNPATSPDASWQPLIVTPPFQEYPSGHAGVSGAGAGALALSFGERSRFAVTSVAMPGVVRRYRGFTAALDDIADARTFGGIHFRFASVDGARMGRQVARYIAHTMLKPLVR